MSEPGKPNVGGASARRPLWVARFVIRSDQKSSRSSVGARRCLPHWLILLFTLSIAVVRAGGSNSACIHLSPEAPAAVRSAADELASWFKKASSAELPVTTNAFTGHGVYLTVASQDQVQKAPAKLAKLGPEGIYVRATTSNLYLVANSELAISEGVYVYLEKLGFRWFLPNEAWHIVPQTTNLFVETEILIRPD
jgi:hypothetical protein